MRSGTAVRARHYVSTRGTKVVGVKRFWQGVTAKLRHDRRPERVAPPVTQPPAAPPQRAKPTAPPRADKPASSAVVAARPHAPHVPTRGHRAGQRRLAYAPQLDGHPDPGEVVWTWVKYEDDPHQGKDRPVLVVGREGNLLLGLMLSSRGERDGQPSWLPLGGGAWDREDRPSWVRLDRVLEVAEDGIRREGAVLDRNRFDTVAQALRQGYGWA